LHTYTSHGIGMHMSNKITVVKNSATWCGPCRTLQPIFEQVKSAFPDVEFQEIDVDNENPYNVRAVPTIVFLKNGKEVDRTQGMKTVDQLKNIITNAQKNG